MAGSYRACRLRGGSPTPVLRKDVKRQELSLRFPSFLPDGQHYLYTVGSDDKEVRGIYLGSLDGSLRQRLLGDYSNVIYVASDNELRLIAGLSFEEIAEAIKVSVGTIRRDLSLAEAWLFRELNREEQPR